MPKENRLAKLDRLSSDAAAANEAALRAVADEIFSYAPELYQSSNEAISRLIRAESKFIHGSVGGISIDRITAAINSFAANAELPEYAYTSNEQIVELRKRLLPFLPHLLRSPVDEVDATAIFSPMQAAYLTIMMIRQKLGNPDFQVSPADWHQHETIRTREELKAALSASHAQSELQKRFNAKFAAADATTAAKVVQQMMSGLDIPE